VGQVSLGERAGCEQVLERRRVDDGDRERLGLGQLGCAGCIASHDAEGLLRD